MRSRTLGADGPEIGRVGLGCMGMSWAYGKADDATAIEVIHRAIELGVTLFDTADVYGPYHNEQLVGRGLRGHREQVFLATKVGLLADGGGSMHANGRPEYIRGAVEGSLARLGVEYVDLYQLHRVDPAVPIEDSWGTLAELVAEGKVRAIGLSEVTVEQIQRAQAVHPVASVQSELSLWTRDALNGGASNTDEGGSGGVDTAVLPYCERQGIAFLPFSPLGRGFLTGKLTSTADFGDDDFRRNLPRFQAEAFDANQVIVAKVRQIADRLGAAPGQVALAWTMAQGRYVVPIPGTKRIPYLEENVAAADLELSADVLAELDGLPDPVGGRYGAAVAAINPNAR